MGENVQQIEILKNELEVLKLNRYYQSLLKTQLFNVEQALKRNKDLQVKLYLIFFVFTILIDMSF